MPPITEFAAAGDEPTEYTRCVTRPTLSASVQVEPAFVDSKTPPSLPTYRLPDASKVPA